MIKRAHELSTNTVLNRFGGQGEVQVTQILEMNEFNGKGRLFARNLLKPGSSIGWHQHTGDFEVYYILSGNGTVDDNGVKSTVTAGDTVITPDGENHSLENTGDVDLEFIALVLYS